MTRIFKGLYAAAAYMDLRRLPELFCGFSRRQRNGPTLYPVACAPQAWASASLFALLQASLGLELRHTSGEIRLNRPVLPEFLSELRIRNVRLNGGEADLMLRRFGQEAAVTVMRRTGGVRVVVQQ